MLTVEETVAIEDTRENVWDYVTDPDRFTTWNSLVADFDADWEDEPSVGDTYRLVQNFLGRRMDVSVEVVDVEPGKSFTSKSVEAPFPVTNTISCEDRNGGTLVTFHAETPGLGGFFGKMSDPIVAKMFGRSMRANLQNLKTLVEES